MKAKFFQTLPALSLVVLATLLPACKGENNTGGGGTASSGAQGVVVNDNEAKSPIPAAPSAPPLSIGELMKTPEYTLEEALKQPADKVYRLQLKGDYSAKVPDEIFQFNNLQQLVFQSCKIANLPVGVVHFQNLRELTIYNNPQLAALPNDWSNLKHIENIGFHHGSQLKGLPASMGGLSTLKRFTLSGPQAFEVFPSPILELKNLTDLNFAGPITELPAEISKMENLRSLTLARTKFTTLPASMGKLKNLGEIWFYDCSELSELPAELAENGKIFQLTISGTKIATLPASFASLPLRSLNLSKSPKVDLTGLAKALNNPKFTSIGISGISEKVVIPAELAELKSLENLSMQDLSFENADKDLGVLGGLSALKTLKLYNCGLKGLPADLGKLSNLKSLDLGMNKELAALPKELAQLAALTKLSLDANVSDELKTQAVKLLPKAEVSWPGKKK